MEQYQWCLFKDSAGLGVHFQQRVAKARLRQEMSWGYKGKLIDAQVVLRVLKQANAKIFWFGSNIRTPLKFWKSLQCWQISLRRFWGWFGCSDTLLMSCESDQIRSCGDTQLPMRKEEHPIKARETFAMTRVVTVPKISVFGTNTSENPRFSVPISVPKQNTKYAN